MNSNHERRLGDIEKSAGIPGPREVSIQKPIEQMTDDELLDIIWPDGRWRAWTDAQLDAELAHRRDGR